MFEITGRQVCITSQTAGRAYCPLQGGTWRGYLPTRLRLGGACCLAEAVKCPSPVFVACGLGRQLANCILFFKVKLQRHRPLHNKDQLGRAPAGHEYPVNGFTNTQ